MAHHITLQHRSRNNSHHITTSQDISSHHNITTYTWQQYITSSPHITYHITQLTSHHTSHHITVHLLLMRCSKLRYMASSHDMTGHCIASLCITSPYDALHYIASQLTAWHHINKSHHIASHHIAHIQFQTSHITSRSTSHHLSHHNSYITSHITSHISSQITHHILLHTGFWPAQVAGDAFFTVFWANSAPKPRYLQAFG